MKKIVVALIISCGFALSSSAQITKASIERMLTELGSSIKSIETFYVGNQMVYYTDGTSKLTYSKYKKNNGDYLNTVQLTNEGVVLKTKKNGAEFAREMFPYSSIRRINIEPNYMGIFLSD